jgi:imidazolonepropionase-like amidohydrolase
MKITVLVSLMTAVLAAQPLTGAPAVAIRGATIVSMTGAPPLVDGTVVIRGDRIADLGPIATTEIPQGARIIEARGEFLIPGLIEMHAHMSKARGSALGLLVANGVTTIRDLGGDHEELLRWRREVNDGRRVGPRMRIAGPYLEAASNIERMRKDPPEARVEPFDRIRIAIGSPEDAVRVVKTLAATELDFLKIRTVQDRTTYLAINRAAAEHGLKVVGHPPALTPDEILDAGQDDIEHGFIPRPDDPPREARLETWRRYARAGVPVVPTLVVFQAGLAPIDRLRAIVADDEGRVEPRRRYLSKFMMLDWKEQLAETTPERQQAIGKLWEPLVRYAREMHEAGVELLAGSDVAVLNIYPGSSLHDELRLFVTDVKMTPAEALERATRRSARFLGIGDSVGTIERGKVADLVLLAADPLQDITNTRRIVAVMSRGVFYDKAGLARLLEAVAAAPDIKVDDWGRRAPQRPNVRR